MQAFVWDGFKGGEDTTTPAARQGKEFSRVVRGFYLDEEGRLRLAPGNQTIYTLPGGGVTRRIFRYHTPALKRLMYTGITALGGGLWALTLTAVDEANVATVNVISTVNVTSATGDDVMFVQEKNTLFFTNPEGALKAWYGNTAVLASDAGIVAPLNAPTLGFGGAGNLKTGNGFAVPFYQWRHTYVDAQGNESNPGVPSAKGVYSDEAAQVTIPPPPVGVDAVTANIYRQGGTISDYFLVGSVTFSVSNIFIDNTGDIDVGTVQMPLSNFLAPAGLDIIYAHRSRLWGASTTGAGETISSIDLWFSALNKYEQFGRETSGGPLDGGRLTLRGGADDGVRCFSSTGSILVVGRARSIWVVFGNKFGEFNASQRVPVGVVSKHAMRRVQNDVYFFATDRQLYRLTDNGVAIISGPIRRSLRLLTQAQVETARLAVCNNKLVLTFETGVAAPNDVAYVFDVIEGAWTEEQGAYARDLQSLPHPTEARDEFVRVPPAGTTVERWLAFPGAEKAYRYQSGEIYNGSAEQTGIPFSAAEHLAIEGTLSAGGTPAALVVTAGGYSRTYALTAANGYDAAATPPQLCDFRLHPDLIGMYIFIALYGTATAMEITKVRLSTSIDREAN